MSRPRGLDSSFLYLMRKGLETGRSLRGYSGWDDYWKECTFPEDPLGPQGGLFIYLLSEVAELHLALANETPERIAEEAADVANLAMMIADIHKRKR